MKMFLLHSTDDGRVPPIEYLPCSAITPKAGMALVQSSGNLAIATGTTKPTYISMIDRASACTAGDIIPVIRIDPDMIFETSFSASAADVKLGQKVTLHASNGGQVTATTTSGVAEVVYMDGTASGSMCRVRFA
ncbi:MAG: hypothetical protein IKQ92_10400 [Clostridia bacterium]|nr:hypothetical protein [Clostridia bacterium]